MAQRLPNSLKQLDYHLTNCSTISYDGGIVLLVCLVDWDSWENVLCLLLFEAVFSKQSGYRVAVDTFQKVQSCPSNALESTCMVYVVHGIESSGQF
jgi:hypothetical protein